MIVRASSCSFCTIEWMPEGAGDIFDRALTSQNNDDRLAACRELQQMVREYVPVVYLYHCYACYLTSDEIINCGTDVGGSQHYLSMYPAEYIEG